MDSKFALQAARVACALALAATGCGDDDAVRPSDAGRDTGVTTDGGGTDTDSGGPDSGGGGCVAGTCPPVADLTRDVTDTSLMLDLTTHAGTAVLTVAGSATSSGATFEVGDLAISSVKLGETELMYTTTDGKLDIGVPAGSEPVALTIAYTFMDHPDFDGWMPAAGVSFLWPYFCGNLFPCHSNPADGSTFTMNVTGAPEGTVLVYPMTIATQAPTYMPAVAAGRYTYLMLGRTTAGTEVGVYYLEGGETDAMAGAGNLDGYFDFYERTYGAYPFGDRVASVSAAWAPDGDYGGMEHHPFWHVHTNSMARAEVHAHEAAHGWFGDGIRIACWEDFVLSEGLATYMAARSIEAADGAPAGAAIWASYQSELDDILAGGGDTIALPDSTCNEIDIYTHPIWSGVPYMKGAFFMRAVEMAVGRTELDAALRHFYEMKVGQAAHMQDLLETIQTDTGFDPTDLANAWLRSMGAPGA